MTTTALFSATPMNNDDKERDNVMRGRGVQGGGGGGGGDCISPESPQGEGGFLCD